MQHRTFRVLLMNLGYATGLDGSLKSYFLRWYRYFYTPRRIIRSIRESIYSLLNREKPDLCCFVEIHRKHGFVPHPHAYTSQIDNKYGRFNVRRFLPFYRDNCNGFFSHHELQFRKRYFTHGSKKLVYEIELGNGLMLLMVHFSLRHSVRRKQAGELKKMIDSRDNIIVCGDFNIFRGPRELQVLAETCNLQIVRTGSTFPAVRPKRTLDLFLCPKHLHRASARVFDEVHISDHLPVMLEVTF